MYYLYLFILVFILTGCLNSSASGVSRVDSKISHLTTVRWGADELQEMAKEMTESFLVSDVLATSEKSVFSFLKIKNSTYDHIDTNSLAEMIKAGLQKSDRVLIVDVDKRNMLHQYENEKTLDNIYKSAEKLSINGFFIGEISAIYQKNDITKDMFFKFTLSLMDIESAEIVWSDEVEIRKLRKKALLSW